MDVEEQRTLQVNITNPSPVPVSLVGYKSSLQRVRLRPDSVWAADGVTLVRDIRQSLRKKIKKSSKHSSSGSGTSKRKPFKPIVLDPGQTVVFGVRLSTTVPEEKRGTLTFDMASRKLAVPVSYTTVTGALTVTPAVVVFNYSFPGLVQRQAVSALSTYDFPVQLHTATASDPRFVPVRVVQVWCAGGESVTMVVVQCVRWACVRVCVCACVAPLVCGHYSTVVRHHCSLPHRVSRLAVCPVAHRRTP